MKLTKEDYDILDCTYPPLFVSTSCNETFVRRLPLLSRDELLSCVRRFRGNVPRECKAKAAWIKLIESDFFQQTKRLIQSSTCELLEHASTSLSADQPTPRFLLVCWAVHNRYGTTIASQLLSSGARWDPPELAEDNISQPVWFQTPVTQLRARLARVDTETIKLSCNLYHAPGSIPKSKTERHDALIQRFRARSLHLLSLLNVDFAREYLALLPEGLPLRSLP